MSEQAVAAVSEQACRVLDALEAGGPELPIVVLSRSTGLLPTQLVDVLDELHEKGYVEQGATPQSVRLLPPAGTGRFRRSHPPATPD